MNSRIFNNQQIRKRVLAFTLIEVAISMAFAALLTSGVIYGYMIASRRAEWSAYSLAAEATAKQRLEQTRASKWDYLSYPQVDQLIATNFPTITTILDVPLSGSNIIYATSYTTITIISTNPPVKMIKVDCIWPFLNGKRFTNSVATMRGPDN